MLHTVSPFSALTTAIDLIDRKRGSPRPCVGQNLHRCTFVVHNKSRRRIIRVDGVPSISSSRAQVLVVFCSRASRTSLIGADMHAWTVLFRIPLRALDSRLACIGSSQGVSRSESRFSVAGSSSSRARAAAIQPKEGVKLNAVVYRVRGSPVLRSISRPFGLARDFGER